MRGGHSMDVMVQLDLVMFWKNVWIMFLFALMKSLLVILVQMVNFCDLMFVLKENLVFLLKNQTITRTLFISGRGHVV